VITVGDARGSFTKRLIDTTASRIVGYGLDEKVQMGPVISPESKARIEAIIRKGIQQGAAAVLDGRGAKISGFEKGNFIKPTILDNLDPRNEITGTEIFGPVLGLLHVSSIEEAIALTNSARYGNMACLFTSSGAHARQFR